MGTGMWDPTADRLARAYSALSTADPVLGRLVERWGIPDPFAWNDTVEINHGRGTLHNFDAMVLHILRQQVSLASADAAYDRLTSLLEGPVSADRIACLTPEALRAAGLTRQKASYLHSLAERQASGGIDLERMAALTDSEAVAALTALRGVGRWTAEVFLINQLHREDIPPAADVGLQRAARSAFGLPRRPTEQELRDRGERWGPFRTYAAQLLWYSLPEVHGWTPATPTEPPRSTR